MCFFFFPPSSIPPLRSFCQATCSMASQSRSTQARSAFLSSNKSRSPFFSSRHNGGFAFPDPLVWQLLPTTRPARFPDSTFCSVNPSAQLTLVVRSLFFTFPERLSYGPFLASNCSGVPCVRLTPLSTISSLFLPLSPIHQSPTSFLFEDCPLTFPQTPEELHFFLPFFFSPFQQPLCVPVTLPLSGHLPDECPPLIPFLKSSSSSPHPATGIDSESSLIN